MFTMTLIVKLNDSITFTNGVMSSIRVIMVIGSCGPVRMGSLPRTIRSAVGGSFTSLAVGRTTIRRDRRNAGACGIAFASTRNASDRIFFGRGNRILGWDG